MADLIDKPEINKLSMKNGLLIGGICVVLSIVFYLMDPLLQYTNSVIGMLYFAIVIALLVVLGIDTRKKIGGFWSFGEAFKSLLITSFFIVLLSILFSFILFKYVAPTLPAKVAEATSELLNARLGKLGMDQAKIDETIKNADMEAKMQPTLVNELKNFAIAFAGYAVCGLIIAAIIKKKPPIVPISDELADIPATE